MPVVRAAAFKGRARITYAAAPPAVTDADCGCDDPGILMNDVSVSGSSLRAMTLVDQNGKQVQASSLLGEDGKAVVVFGRYLG